MAISHITKLYGVVDAKIYELTADPAGGPAVYAGGIDVPGIKSVEVTGDIKSVELRGDNTLLDSDASLQKVNLKFNYAKLNLDALAVLLGGTVTDGGAGSTETATFRRTGADVFKYFKFEAKCVGVDELAGDGHIVIYKAKLAEFPQLGFAEEDYQLFSVGATAIPRRADNVWWDIVVNETAATISA
jgi:hypothetical protein